MERRKSYHRRDVIVSLVAVLSNKLGCERKYTATLVTSAMQHELYANLARKFGYFDYGLINKTTTKKSVK